MAEIVEQLPATTGISAIYLTNLAASQARENRITGVTFDEDNLGNMATALGVEIQPAPRILSLRAAEGPSYTNKSLRGGSPGDRFVAAEELGERHQHSKSRITLGPVLNGAVIWEAEVRNWDNPNIAPDISWQLQAPQRQENRRRTALFGALGAVTAGLSVLGGVVAAHKTGNTEAIGIVGGGGTVVGGLQFAVGMVRHAVANQRLAARRAQVASTPLLRAIKRRRA